MAPTVRHPPCTPSASCTPIRCHPAPPPCQNPERCLKRTTSKGIRPCRSAVSIMATKSKAQCSTCCANSKNAKSVDKFLSEKSKEAKMKKRDRLKGTQSHENYTKRKGSVRSKTECCHGKGHRGRLKKKKCCAIL